MTEPFLLRVIVVTSQAVMGDLCDAMLSRPHIAKFVQSFRILNIEGIQLHVLAAIPPLLRSLNQIRPLTLFISLETQVLFENHSTPIMELMVQFAFPNLSAFTTNLLFSHAALARFQATYLP